MARTGRPKIPIDKKQFENLCALFCTKQDIADFFECSEDTIENWCKKTYQDENGKPMTFSAVYKNKKSKGKVSLRRMQHNLAKKNASMAIFLGKQELGQRDVIEQQMESPNVIINISPASPNDIEED